MTFEIYTSRSVTLRKQWRWRLRAANGRIIATSGEGYHNRADMLAIIDKMRSYVPVAEQRDVS